MKTKEVSQKQLTAITCECGFIVSGSSEEHARANLKQHRKYALHKRQMMMKKEISTRSVSASGAIIIQPKSLEGANQS